MERYLDTWKWLSLYLQIERLHSGADVVRFEALCQFLNNLVFADELYLDGQYADAWARFEPVNKAHAARIIIKKPFKELVKEWITGASRSWLLDMEAAGRLKIVRIRQPGKMRGSCFLYVPSLMALLREQLEGGAK